MKAPSQPPTQISAAPSPSLEADKQRLAEERAKLERERQELERLKMEIEREKLEAERKRVEAEKKKLEMAKVPPKPTYPPSVSKPAEIARDGRFIAYGNGTVKDTSTGLMWAAKDSRRDVTWQEAKAYCESYGGGGYTDWRMPTQDELAGLYDKNKSYQAKQRSYNVHLTELIELTACCPWASETSGSEAARFGFVYGEGYWSHQSGSVRCRAVPVRSGK